MSLPVINVPTYELDIPSTKEKIKYRPFLGSTRRKLLLLAIETSEEESIGYDGCCKADHRKLYI